MFIRLFRPPAHARGGRETIGIEQGTAPSTSARRITARVAAAAALLAIGSATALGEGVLTAQVAAAQQRVSDLIAGRSPGRRVVMMDLKKGKRGLDNPRVARALPRVREPRSFYTPPLTGLGGADDFVPPFVEPPLEFAGLPPGGFFYPGGGFFFPGGGGLIFFPPGGGGGGGGGGGCCVVPPEGPPTPPAVPEPATWAMMVLGFGAAGYAIRRRRHGGRAHA